MDMYQKREMRKTKKMDENTKSLPSTSINWYPGHMAKTKRLIKENLQFIDVVYEVVDARIPYSSKIIDIDTYIQNKPRVMILTKYDLCDKKETDQWISYYEKQGYVVIPMDIEHHFVKKKIVDITKNLMEETRKKMEAKGMKKDRIRVLVVGIPNVGKSTLINRLVGKKVVSTGNKPGVTKQLDWIRIDDTLELLDTPGILWPKIDVGNVAYNLASLTAIKEEILPLFDVVEYILNMLYQYYPEILKNRYQVEQIDDDIVPTLEFIGKRRGCLVKGGEIDYEKVMALIMNDMKSGLISQITFDRYGDIHEL